MAKNTVHAGPLTADEIAAAAEAEAEAAAAAPVDEAVTEVPAKRRKAKE